MATKKSLGKRVVANLGKKWVQLVFCVALLAAAVTASGRVFAPPPPDPKKQKDPNVYKFLICDKCGFEVTYNADLDGKPCPRHKAGEAGFFKASKESAKAGGGPSEWRVYNIAVGLEALAWLGLVYYLLSRPVDDPAAKSYALPCLHCGETIRYRADGFGRYAQCPRCQGLLKLPDDDEAVTVDEQHEAEADSLIGQFEDNLRETGHHPIVKDEGEGPAGGPAPGDKRP